VGIARSGNRHGPRALAESSGEGYLYGVEFVELDLGDADEMRLHAGERNAIGFHGNAIPARLKLADPHLIPLDDSGLWFTGQEGAQRRGGGRMALAARIDDAPGPVWVVSVHLESKTDPPDRAAPMRRLFDALHRIAPDAPCVIGGDLNTKALPHEQWDWFAAPQAHEPLFAQAAEAGFA
jgi:endonuclease/exonuclease/phosphatase family metal-dependent hydrolase